MNAGLRNLFADLPTHLPGELLTMLLEAGGMRIERIISRGHASPDGFWSPSPHVVGEL